MTPQRKQAVLLLVLAVACAIGAFAALFVGGTNHAIATGILILGLVGFWVLYSKAFDLWSSARDATRPDEGPEARG